MTEFSQDGFPSLRTLCVNRIVDFDKLFQFQPELEILGLWDCAHTPTRYNIWVKETWCKRPIEERRNLPLGGFDSSVGPMVLALHPAVVSWGINQATLVSPLCSWREGALENVFGGRFRAGRRPLWRRENWDTRGYVHPGKVLTLVITVDDLSAEEIERARVVAEGFGRAGFNHMDRVALSVRTTSMIQVK